MPQKQQKEVGKGSNKSSNGKESNRGDKKSLIGKPTAQELEQIQNQRIKQFFGISLQKINLKIDISSVDLAIVANIINGELRIPEQPKNLSSLIKSPEEQAAMKITPEQMEIYEKQAKRIEHLKLIANLNKQLTNKQPEENIPYILTKEEHERKMRQIIEEKKAREKKMEEIRIAQKERIQKQEKEAKEKLKQLKNQEKEKRRIEIQEKITKQKEQHIHFLSFDIKHRKDLEEVLTKVPLHVKMEQKFKVSVQLPELEQKKQEYKQLREFKQRYSLENIREHDKEFLQKSREKLQQSKMRKFSSLSTIQENLPKAPQKPERLKSILAEEIQKFKKQWSQRENYVEQKQRREENYLKKLKEQFQPKIDKAKQQEMEKRLMKEKQHLAKVGLEIDKRKVGLQYLGEVKKLPKKRRFDNTGNSDGLTLKHQYRSQILLPSMKRSFTEENVLDRQRNTEFILKSREKRFSKILNSQQEPEQKLKLLEIQTQKIQEVKRQKLGFLKHNFDEIASKEASNLALNSIKAKMNLIELIKKQ